MADYSQTPAGRLLAQMNTYVNKRGQTVREPLPGGTPFSRTQHLQTAVYAGGAIITHMPKSKVHYRRIKPL